MGSSFSFFFFPIDFEIQIAICTAIGHYREGEGKYLFRLISLENGELESMKWKGNGGRIGGKNVLKYWKLVKYYGLYCEPVGCSRRVNGCL